MDAPSLGPDMDPGRRGISWLRAGELLVFGARGLAARLVPGARPEPGPSRQESRSSAPRRSPGTTVTLVGERPTDAGRGGGRAGDDRTIAQFARGKLMLLADVPACTRLRG